MKRILFAVSLFILTSSAFAWTIGPMNYQGRLLDNNGIPVTGTYAFTVNIYDALTNGTLKFSEQQNNIAVSDGVYSFLVSTGVTNSGTWDINLWNTPTLYLEIVVNGQTLTPRHLLAAAPFAFQANLALTTNNALALGGVTAGQYQNTLAAICASTKGKWLELVQKCLGAGSSFPGPTMVALNTLTASTTLTNLDLSRADISGINFGSANLSGTHFEGATLNVQGIKNTNLSNTIITGVTNQGSAIVTASLVGASIGTTDLSGWNMSSAALAGASIADLSACPSALPVNYSCEDEKSPSDGERIVVGPNMNFSDTSLLKDRFNSNDLSNYLVGWLQNYTGANFSKNHVAGPYPIFQNAVLVNANFKGADISRMNFGGSYDGASFADSTILNCGFFGSMIGVSFSSANLTNVLFGPGDNSSLDFSLANLVNPIFISGSGLSLNFETSTLTNPSFVAGISNLSIVEGTKIFGGLYLGNQVTYAYFFEAYFSGGNISGNFTTSEFSSSSEFYNVSFNGANFTGVHNLGSSDFYGVNWFGATCPDGYQVTTQGGTCVGHFLP